MLGLTGGGGGDKGNTINGDFLATLDDFIYPNINCHVGPK